MDWAEEEERKELEELKKQQEAGEEVGSFDANQDHQPSKEEQEWMQKHLDEQMKKMKEQYGDDLYEDVNIEETDGE